MPLPAMMGSDETLMSSPGMQQASPLGDPGDQSVTPQDQARGAIEALSKLRQANTEQLEAVATQFPQASKAAKEVMQAMTQAIAGLVKEIIKTTQPTDQRGPAGVR
jgi:hypothetical protein